MEEEGGHSGMTALGGTWGLTDSIPVGEAAGDGGRAQSVRPCGKGVHL